ncbi:uncharacterized protein LOC113374824 [Ctenocephalides felis]|uniref:uncharacterized protein LOC113374824 n=1 Tax=Ctenocephalides felis TaxID=7515 RepID=UPI000E6E264E|nr:uncharacterized protein LOC113374824 [Ctenocephalides felis]
MENANRGYMYYPTYKDQTRYLLSDLNQRYIMLQRPYWLVLPLVVPMMMFACLVAAMLSNCYVEASTVISGVLEHTERIAGMKFRFNIFELYGSAVVTGLLAYAQYSGTNNVYCIIPWILWTLSGMIFKEVPGLYLTCAKIMRLSVLHGVLLSVAATILLYMQFNLVRIIWRKKKLDLCKDLVGHLSN